MQNKKVYKAHFTTNASYSARECMLQYLVFVQATAQTDIFYDATELHTVATLAALDDCGLFTLYNNIYKHVGDVYYAV